MKDFRRTSAIALKAGPIAMEFVSGPILVTPDAARMDHSAAGAVGTISVASVLLRLKENFVKLTNNIIDMF